MPWAIMLKPCNTSKGHLQIVNIMSNWIPFWILDFKFWIGNILGEIGISECIYRNHFSNWYNFYLLALSCPQAASASKPRE